MAVSLAVISRSCTGVFGDRETRGEVALAQVLGERVADDGVDESQIEDVHGSP